MTDGKGGKPPVVDFGHTPFTFTREAGFGVLKLAGPMDHDLLKEFEKRIGPQLEGFSADLILDLSQCVSISPAWTRTLMKIVSGVKAANRRVRVVAHSLALREFFQQQGVESHFPFVPSREMAVQQLSSRKAYRLDVAFLNPFLDGTVDVLKVHCALQAKAGTPAVMNPVSPFGADIAGMIMLLSDRFHGRLALAFPKATYLQILSRMRHEEFSELKPEIHDGAAELVNFVYAYGKRVLNSQDHGLKLTAPSFVIGTDAGFPNAPSGPCLSVPFETDVGPFTLAICAGD